MDSELIIEKAKEARKKAYAPYSNFFVGAAVLTKSGRIFTGCNIENVAYGLTICAEACAIAKTVSEGYKDIKAVALVADTESIPFPCGSCRQIILEFGDDIRIIMANLRGDSLEKIITELLPLGFTKIK